MLNILCGLLTVVVMVLAYREGDRESFWIFTGLCTLNVVIGIIDVIWMQI